MRVFFSAISALFLLWGCQTDSKPSGTTIVGDTASLLLDVDGDGYDSSEDCDDNNSLVHPNAAELCDGADNDCDGTIDEDVSATFYDDDDGDGFGDPDDTAEACEAPSGMVPIGNDCDDQNEDSYPGATEICDGADNDCDGDVDEGLGGTWYPDEDGDGFGDRNAEKVTCTETSGYVSNALDCDDLDDAIHPDATEVCDGVDNNCDDQVDEGLTSTWYQDGDGDGYGGTAVEACTQPSDTVINAGDCDDGNAAVHPDATEVCNGIDDDCDGRTDVDAIDAQTFYSDSDSDGYGDGGTPIEACSQPSGSVTDSTDCDDGDAAINPGAVEVCNGVDDDCNGDIDSDAADKSTYYADGDSDGYGDASTSVSACTLPSGHVSDSTDCDDGDGAVNPGATEVCNSIDDDCDGGVDEGSAAPGTYYADSDSDGYGNADDTTEACSVPTGYVSDSSDCDDSDGAVNPGATEVCNNIDDDCDGSIDESGAAPSIYYADDDGDGYGDASDTVESCGVPTGYVSDDSDCDDGDGAVNPGATEVCNSIDDDCDGDIDDDDSSLDASTRTAGYADDDGDGYGDVGDTLSACSLPTGYVTDDSDCDDGDGGINPGATEVCDGFDNDCDGSVDEGSAAPDTFYADDDGDGYGDVGDTVESCSAPTGYVSNDSDCDDGDGAVNPGATEVCNSIDDDCDGDIDDDDSSLDPSSGYTYYADDDLDGYGDSSDVIVACEEPSGYVSDDSDCDDGEADTNPGATDECNGIDDDCSGDADDTGLCPCDVEHYDGHPYMFCDFTQSWSNAESYCASYDYDFLTISDAAEDAWIDTIADSLSTSKWWFGLNDISSEGSFVWSDGSTSTYTNWHSGEPNNSGGNEDCAQINRFTDGSWNDEPCADTFYFICEAD